MVKDPYFDTNEVTKRRTLSDTHLQDEEFRRYGFWSISFLHVLLAKLFFLPIIMIVMFGMLLISIGLKIVKRDNKIVKNIHYFALFGVCFNVPLRYMLEMY